MNLSVTVKSHGVEDLLLYRMKKITGGIGKLIEQWVEKYHQVGSQCDDTWRLMPSDYMRAKTRAKREYVGTDPRVIKKKIELNNRFDKGKRKSSQMKQMKKAKIKH